MSNYKRPAKNPVTGEWDLAEFVDDCFGPHLYGVRFPGEKATYKLDDVEHRWEVLIEDYKALKRQVEGK